VPVEFLSDDQVAAYLRFVDAPPQADLERFFFLDKFDRDLIALRRSDCHRLGFALQVGTVRAKGLFLEDPLDVPWLVVDYLAEQLGIADASVVKGYCARRGPRQCPPGGSPGGHVCGG
jgi:hypothetical protein